MFRFDFKDKGMIPPILGTDNTDYLERLCPVLERERIHPSGSGEAPGCGILRGKGD